VVETQINRRLGGCQVTLAELIENTILTARDGYRMSLELIRDRVLTTERQIDLLVHRTPFRKRKRHCMANQRTPVYSIFISKIYVEMQCYANAKSAHNTVSSKNMLKSGIASVFRSIKGDETTTQI